MRHILRRYFGVLHYVLADDSGSVYRSCFYDERYRSLLGLRVLGRVRHLHRGFGGAFISAGDDMEGFVKRVNSDVCEGDLLPLTVSRDLSGDKGYRFGLGWRVDLRYFSVVAYGSDRRVASAWSDLWCRMVSDAGLAVENYSLQESSLLSYVDVSALESVVACNFRFLLACLLEWESVLRDGGRGARVLARGDFLREVLFDIVGVKGDVMFMDGSLLEESRHCLGGLAPDLVSDFRMVGGDSLDFGCSMCASLGREYIFADGGRLVIDEGEAGILVDIDSGSATASIRRDFLSFNLSAAVEVIRLIGLLDLGGIILVDFIRMRSAKSRHILLERLRDLSRDVGLDCDVLGYSRSGLVEILRRRGVPSLLRRMSLCSADELYFGLAALDREYRRYRGGALRLRMGSGAVSLFALRHGDLLGSLPLELVSDDEIDYPIVENV